MICKTQMVLGCFPNVIYNRSILLSRRALKCPKIDVLPISVKQTGGASVIDILWDKRWEIVPLSLSAISLVGYWGAMHLWGITRPGVFPLCGKLEQAETGGKTSF